MPLARPARSGAATAAVAALGELRDKPSGTIRITSGEHAATTILWPVLEKFLPQYPEIHVEVVTDVRLTDIVAERFDAGVRLGESLPEDMVDADVTAGNLRCVLGDWSPPFAGYHLYYPSRRQHSPAFALLVEALRRHVVLWQVLPLSRSERHPLSSRRDPA